MCRYGVNKLEGALSPLVKQGLKAVLVFGVPTKAKNVYVVTPIPGAITHTSKRCSKYVWGGKGKGVGDGGERGRGE